MAIFLDPKTGKITAIESQEALTLILNQSS